MSVLRDVVDVIKVSSHDELSIQTSGRGSWRNGLVVFEKRTETLILVNHSSRGNQLIIIINNYLTADASCPSIVNCHF